jgi:hypothetical protein
MYFTYKIAGQKGKQSWAALILGIIISAISKFVALFLLVRFVIKAFFAPQMPDIILAMFSYPQLLTALMGGFLSIAVVMALKKADVKGN